MSYTAIQAALVAHLEAVADIGRVHDRPRYGDAFDHWTVAIDGQTQVRAWEVGVDDRGIETSREEQNFKWRRHRIRIRGWVSLVDDDGNDAGSYQTIVNLAHAIADRIDPDFNLGGACLQHDLVQIGEPTPVFLPLGDGELLCWAVDLTLDTLSILSLDGT